MNGRTSFATVLTAALLALAACSSSGTSPETAPDATTAAATPSATATKTATSAAPAATVKAAKIKVPDGAGMDYQSAQDVWRAVGLHVAPAKDATGANRLPVIDSNWVVVAQSPKAGATVEVGSFITATVKKDTDG
jgi:phage baseplate assembly protein gpV